MEIFYLIDELPKVAREILNFSDEKVFLFYGSMGVGKTTLIKELCSQLKTTDVVSSPTFGIVNEYNSEFGSIYHFDFYRLEKASEALDMGIEDYFYGDSFVFVEWPEKIDDYLPESATKIEISKVDDRTRKIVLSN